MKRKGNLLVYLVRNITIAVGLVLIWRGIWLLLDGIDKIFFGGSHILTAVGGVIIGVLVLYLPDRDLKELERL